jgi:hypothetical protein
MGESHKFLGVQSSFRHTLIKILEVCYCGVPSGPYVVIDLYGVCGQVGVENGESHEFLAI